MAYFGAKVIHPKTMSPAIMNEIPIYIRNTFFPNDVGTKIYKAADKIGVAASEAVIGFSTVDDMAMVTVEGTALIGKKGSAVSCKTQIFLLF